MKAPASPPSLPDASSLVPGPTSCLGRSTYTGSGAACYGLGLTVKGLGFKVQGVGLTVAFKWLLGSRESGLG